MTSKNFRFLNRQIFSKPFQVVAVAVVTTVTQEGAEAHGAAGYEVHTDDVIPLFQSILMFVSCLCRPHLLDLFLSRRADLKQQQKNNVQTQKNQSPQLSFLNKRVVVHQRRLPWALIVLFSNCFAVFVTFLGVWVSTFGQSCFTHSH